MTGFAMPRTQEDMLALLDTMSDDELRDLYEMQSEFESRLAVDGPQSDDELHAWILEELSINIPRVAVCEDHQAPFDFVADVFFERVKAVLVMGARSSGKTFLMAILHWCNSRFKPGCESCTFGAIEEQSFRAYEHLSKWVFDKEGIKRPEIINSMMRKTMFKNGSSVIVLGSTPAAVNGPHPNKVHADEVELMREDTWRESQPIDTLIPTPGGMKRLGDLRFGEYVFGSDGLPTKIIKIKDYGEEDVYKLTLTDGRVAEACDDHLWVVAGNSQRVRGTWKVCRTSEIRANGVKLSSSYRYGLPHNKAVEFYGQELPLHPYVLGVLLGDGYFGTQSTSFRSVDNHIVDRVRDLLPDGYGVNSSMNKEGYEVHNIVMTIRQRNFRTIVNELGMKGLLSQTKYIPDAYKYSSSSDRLEVIRGLMDTDGCAISGNPVGQYATISERLARDVADIVFSLGGRAIVRLKNFKTEWSSGVIYTVDISFSGKTMPFTLPRKVEKMVMRQRTLDPSIKSVEFSRRSRVRCIGVDNADSTYLTSSYIVTHNSRNMSSAGRTVDGKLITPQDILTSTRKGPSGRMQMLIDEIDEAVREGFEPPRTMYAFCIKEAAKERPDCRRAPPESREARLAELKLPTNQLCGCHLIRKGEWDDGKPRTLDQVCDGDFAKSRGHEEPEEVEKHFRENDRNTFEVQQLCLMPEMKYHYFSEFRDAHHAVRHYIPDPENGPIFTSVDWGGTNPHSVHWYQLLQVEVHCDGWLTLPDGTNPKVRLREGTVICFDEIYKAEIGNDKLGNLVIGREAEWARVVPGFRVRERFADPQGKAAKLDWREMGLVTRWHTTRDFEEHIKIVRDMAGDDLLRVDARCEKWIWEVKNWRKDEKTLTQIDKDNHAMSDFRYALANIKKLKRKFAVGKSLPGASGVQRRRAPMVRVVRTQSGPVGYRGRDEFADWRKSLGSPINEGNS